MPDFKGATITNPTVDKIRWTEVDVDEYNSADMAVPHRATFKGINVMRYELGREPIEPPTGEYAVVGPADPRVAANAGHRPYIRIDGKWFGVSDDSYSWEADEVEVFDLLNSTDEDRFEVIFPGL